MTKMKPSLFLTFFVLAIAIVIAQPTTARTEPIPLAINNGGFETGTLAGWVFAGDVAVINNTTLGSAPQGQYKVVLSTAPGFQPAGAFFNSTFTFSGHNSISLVPGIEWPQIETRLGSTQTNVITFAHAHYLANLNETLNLNSGSVIGQQFFANAGDTLRFDFNLLTYEGAGLDLAVVVLDGNIMLPGDIFHVHPSASVFPREIGYRTVSLPITSTGNHILGIGVFDSVDDQFLTAVLLDNFRVDSGLADIPEPRSIVLLASGLIGVIAFRRRNKV